MNLCFIVNPNAGKKKGVFLAENAVELLKERGHTTELRVSSGPGDTRTLAADLDTGPFDGVVAVGGDGTLFEVINGLLTGRNEIPVPVGQIPVGTGNSFIKDLDPSTIISNHNCNPFGTSCIFLVPKKNIRISNKDSIIATQNVLVIGKPAT